MGEQGEHITERTYYAVFGLDSSNSKGYVYEIVQDVASAIKLLVRTLTDRTTLKAKSYEIQFIKCNCELSEKDRQNVIRRHVSVNQKQKLAKQRTENYAAMEPEKKRAKYAHMEPCEKKALSIANAEKYSAMKPDKKRALSVANAEKYRQMDSAKKNDVIDQIVTKRKELKEKENSSTRSLDYYIEQFNRGIREGPYYICVVCNRLLYRKSVLEFKKEKYNCSSSLFTSVETFNGKMYI